MSLAWVYRCDQCQKREEAERIDGPSTKGWLRIGLRGEKLGRHDGIQLVEADVCSETCAINWIKGASERIAGLVANMNAK